MKNLFQKKVEGCSEKTLKYYLATIEAVNSSLEKDVRIIQTEDLRKYLTDYLKLYELVRGTHYLTFTFKGGRQWTTRNSNRTWSRMC